MGCSNWEQRRWVVFAHDPVPGLLRPVMQADLDVGSLLSFLAEATARLAVGLRDDTDRVAPGLGAADRFSPYPATRRSRKGHQPHPELPGRPRTSVTPPAERNAHLPAGAGSYESGVADMLARSGGTRGSR